MVLPVRSDLNMDDDDKIVYEVGKYYEITLRPYKQDPLSDLRFVNATVALRKTLQDMDLKYLLMPEYSMCKYSYDKYNPRITYIHWHGYVYFENISQLESWLCTGFNKLSNEYHIQLNPSRAEWKEYIIKQRDIVPKQYRIKNIKKIKHDMSTGVGPVTSGEK